MKPLVVVKPYIHVWLYNLFSAVAMLAESPAVAQNHHSVESPPKQSSPSQLTSSPSMPSLSSCSTGGCTCFISSTVKCLKWFAFSGSQLTFIAFQDQESPAPQTVQATVRTIRLPSPSQLDLRLLPPKHRKARALSLMTFTSWWITGPEMPSASPSARKYLKVEHRQHWDMM